MARVPPLSTFSIAAWDPVRQDWGAAVLSNYLAVGALVPFVRAQVGVVLTQATASRPLAEAALAGLAEGLAADEVLAGVIGRDRRAPVRQVAVLDSNGRAAVHTGEECREEAGHVMGERYLCTGNTLLPGTLDAMGAVFEAARSAGQGELADWLLAALAAGAAAGGDRRGELAAALLVARPDGGFGGDNDRYVDLRVDAHGQPIQTLRRLLAIHHLYYQDAAAEAWQDLHELDSTALEALARSSGIVLRTLQARDDAAMEGLVHWFADHNIEHALDPARWRVRRELSVYLSLFAPGNGVPSKSSQLRVSKR